MSATHVNLNATSFGARPCGDNQVHTAARAMRANGDTRTQIFFLKPQLLTHLDQYQPGNCGHRDDLRARKRRGRLWQKCFEPCRQPLTRPDARCSYGTRGTRKVVWG